MKKEIREGKVAVLVSPGYGAGWYSWHDIDELLFDPKVVKLVEKKEAINCKLEDANIRGDVTAKTSLDKQYYDIVEQIEEYAKEAYKNELGHEPYVGGAVQLVVVWLDEGEEFIIDEYDGSESIETKDDTKWMVA